MVAPLSAASIAMRVQRSESWVQSPRFRVTCPGPVRCEIAVFRASRVEFKGSQLTKGAAQSGLPFRRSYRVKPGG